MNFKDILKFCFSEDSVKKINRQATGKKIITIYCLSKDLYPEYVNTSYNLNDDDPMFRNGQKTEIDISQKKRCKWPIVQKPMLNVILIGET